MDELNKKLKLTSKLSKWNLIIAFIIYGFSCFYKESFWKLMLGYLIVAIGFYVIFSQLRQTKILADLMIRGKRWD